MKIIIDKEFPIEIVNAKDSLDVADYFDDKGIKFSFSWGYWVILEEQEIDLSPVHLEDLFDKLNACGVNISLERVERGIYYLRTY